MTVVLNDLHLAAVRKGGTTPASQAALRVFQYEQLDRLLLVDDDILVNGDLFDSFAVDPGDVIMTFNTFSDWLHTHPTRHLILSAGNHDWNPRAGKTSSFHLLSHFLKTQFPSRVRIVDYTDGLTKVGDGVYVIPHVANQDLHDLEIQKVHDLDHAGWLLLHANYSNPFAANADHSLNVSQEQLDALLVKGWSVLLAHEHQHRVLRGGRLIIAGNQLVTSVSDCLGCDGKYYVKLDNGDAEIVQFAKRDDVYAEIDWRDLPDAPDAKFIRVVGEATAEEASAVVDAVAKFRQSSQAYVVSNATKIDGVAGFDALAEVSLEQISAFSVLDSLLEELTEEEGRIVKELLEC